MADANTASLRTNLNVNPYFDDFDETKNFHRILFKPGLAVQARELTQSQTILQNQVDRFAEHIFKEGSVVQGGEFNYDQDAPFVKIQDFVPESSNTEVDVTNFTHPDFLVQLTGNTSNVTAVVIQTQDGLEAAAPDTKTFYIKYTSSGSNNTVNKFQPNEILIANTGSGNGAFEARVLDNANTATGIGSSLTISEGIIFAKDHFIRVPEQRIIIGDFEANVSSRIGYDVQETIISSEDDSTLVDPARGSFNFNAPGADRLKINPVLTKKDVDDFTSDESFVEIVRIKNSQPEFQANKPDYSKINDYIANRTYEESGNYLVNGLHLRMREHLSQSNNNGVFTAAKGGDVNKLSVDVSPGTAYIYGYRQESITTAHIPIDKGTDFNSVEQLSTTTNYGNYVRVNEVAGNWDVNEQTIVSLRNDEANTITNGTYSQVSAPGSEIGVAKVKSLEYVSGTPGDSSAEYNLHLYDIKMSGSSFEDVRSIYTSNTSANSVADPVLVSNSAVIRESAFNSGVFRIPASSIKTIRDENGSIDTTFKFLKSFSVSVATDGSFSISTGSADEQYPFGLGTLNSTQKLENFDIIMSQDVGRTDSGSYKAGERVDLSAANNDITVTGSTSADFNIGPGINSITPAIVTMRLNKVDGQEKSKIYNKDRFVKIDVANNVGGTSGPWNLGLSDVLTVEEVRLSSSAFTNDTDGTDVTEEFNFDSGQRDNFYGHAKLKKKDSSNLTVGASDHILIKLSYFTHDTSQGVGYFSVDSYPIDDSNIANTNAIATQDIPIFISPITGEEYDLRDSIDIRPRITDTAVNSTTVTDASIDPATNTSYDVPSGGLHYSPPNENFLTDLDYYLPRIDKIAIDRIGNFRSIRGVSSNNPRSPNDPSDGMVIGEIFVTPFPSITPSAGQNSGRTDLAVKVSPRRIERFTMEQIGTLQQRIENLEYYTALSLLEADAKSFSITDSAGIDRFKNGILVDNFEGGSVSDIDSPDFKVSIDQNQKECRPPVKADLTELEYDSSLSSGVQLNPKDSILTISNISGTFIKGETVSQGGNSGKLVYKVDSKLYLEDVSGTFTGGGTVTGGSSGATADIDSVKVITGGEYATLPYSHDLVIEQNKATGTRNIAGLLYTWFGELELSPEEDIWMETVQAPDVNINIRKRNDIWLKPRNITTRTSSINARRTRQRRRIFGNNFGWWNDRTGVRGSAQQLRRALNTNIGRTSVSSTRRVSISSRVDVIDRNVETDVEVTNKIIGTEVIPHMRSRVIEFEATAIKPNTRFYAFFDGEDVNEHVRPTDSSFNNTGSYGAVLISDNNGKLYGKFRIPNNNELRFRTGTLSLRLTDSSTDNRESGAFTSFAEGDFTSAGNRTVTQDTITTTRTINITRRRTTTRNIHTEMTIRNTPNRQRGGGGGGGGGDPVAQTFRVNDSGNSPDGTSGAFLTKFDLYFQTKDDVQPVIIEIREVDPSSGYVTSKIIPLSRIIVPASDVNVSQDGSKPTPVYFPTPIFLRSDTDYAVVVKPGADTPNYIIFVARLGERDLITGARVGINPYSGALFASSNDRVWTAIQEEDLKFNAYFANFGKNNNGSAIFTNKDYEFLTVNNQSSAFQEIGEEVHGETTLTMSTATSANSDSTEYAFGNTSGANGVITDSSGSTLKLKDVTVTEKFQNGEVIDVFFVANNDPTGESYTISSQSTPTGKLFQYDDIDESPLVYLDDSTGNFVVGTQIKEQSDSGTTADIEALSPLNVDIINPYLSKLDFDQTTTATSAKFAITTSSKDSDYIVYKENEDSTPKNRKFVLGRTDEVNGLSGNKSLELKVDISNENNNRHSPIIDISKSGMHTIENFVNQVTTPGDEAVTEGGPAEAKYITRTVTLAEGQDAEDLRVLIESYKPSSAQLYVYYKILNSTDADDINERPWVQMDQETQSSIISDNEDLNDFIDYEFSVPAAELTGPNDEIQYTDSLGVTQTGFKYFKIKIVLSSTSTVNPPRLKNLRTIALQV